MARGSNRNMQEPLPRAVVGGERKIAFNRDIALPAGLLIGCSLLVLWLIPDHIQIFDETNDLGPRFFPYLVTMAIAGLSLLQLLLIFTGVATPDPLADRLLDARTIFCIASLIAYFAGILVIGMIPSSFLALVAYARTFRIQSWTKAIIYSAVTTALLAAFFELGASVQLPRGLLATLF